MVAQLRAGKYKLARSGLTGAVILLGDSMAPLADTVAVASVERLVEIAGAALLVTLFFTGTSKILKKSSLAKHTVHSEQAG